MGADAFSGGDSSAASAPDFSADGGSGFSGAATAFNAAVLLAQWVFGGSSATKPQPISAPFLTQSQRGIPVPVTFGTNRVPAECFWSKNFTPVRHKGRGHNWVLGALFGLQVADLVSPPTPDQPYTYTIDLGYNFGMVDKPSTILRGWLNGSPMTAVTLAALNQGSSSVLTLSTLYTANGGPYGLQSGGHRLDGVSQLTFADVFYSPGYSTGNAYLEAWPYFAAQEGVTCSWPYTVVLGLQTLDLGTQGQTPQLSLELGSTTTSVNAAALNPKELDYTAGDGGAQINVPTGAFSMIGGDNKHYCLTTRNGSPMLLRIGQMESQASQSITQAQWNADLATLGYGSGTYVTQGSWTGPGTALFWVMGYKYVDGLSNEVAVLRYKINSSGVAVPDGGGIWTTDDNLYPAGLDYDGPYVSGGNCYVALSNNTPTGYMPCVIKLSTTGNYSPSLYSAHLVQLTNWDYSFFFMLNKGRLAANNATIIETADGIGILAYVTLASINGWTGVGPNHNPLIHTLTVPSVMYIPLGADGQTQGASQNLTTTFGLAAWDHMTLYTGSASSDNMDEYQAPCYSGGYVDFIRSFSDNLGYMRNRAYAVTSTVGTLLVPPVITATSAGVTTAQYDATPSSHTIEQMLIWRDATATYVGARSISRVRFGQIATGYVDVTPPYIIYRILTSDVFGFGLPANRINTTSYNAAITMCESLGIFVSVTYATQTSLLSTIDELLALYAGFLVDDAGIIKFGIIQDTDVADSIVVDNTRLVQPRPNTPPVTITKGAVQDGFNIIRVNFLDRAADYNNATVEMADEIDMDTNGPRVKEYHSGYVMSYTTAYRVAERALWSNLYGRSTYSFKLGPKDAHRLPGDLITLVDSFHHELRSGAKARITMMHETSRCVWDTQAISVNDYQISAIHGLGGVSSSYEIDTSFTALQPMLDFRMYEVPTEFGGPTLFIGYNQASAIMGANLYVSLDGASLSLARTATPFIVSGRLTAPLQARNPGFCEDNVTLSLMPASGSSVTSPTYAQTLDWANVTQSDRANGGGVLIVGSEAVSIEGVTSRAQNSYLVQRAFRGWGGTPITSHNSGDFWHYHENGVLALGFTADQIGAKVWYKVTPYDFLGNEYPVSSVDVKTYTIKGDYYLPREQSRIKVWVNSAASWPSSTAFLGTHLKVVAGGADAILTWSDASNSEGYGAGGFGKGTYGHYLADVLTPAYRVDVYSVNGTGVSSFVANTGYFGYTLAQNSADFNGAIKNLWFKVTPYNVKGDGPVTDQRTLTLFW